MTNFSRSSNVFDFVDEKNKKKKTNIIKKFKIQYIRKKFIFEVPKLREKIQEYKLPKNM